jgi:hypothetical protein
MGREWLGFATIDDIKDVDVVVPGTDLNKAILTAKTSSDLSMTIELKLNSHILKDFVQFFSKTSKIFKKPSWPIVRRVLGLLLRCKALLI